jgi:[NiFe] hydrogenase assembly HybE family chaperone
MTKTAFQLPTPEALTRRVAALAAHFESVRLSRMAGIPMLNPVLQVEAVGFVWADVPEGGDVLVAEGVLITPWFMNLVRLPSQRLPHANRVARKFVRDFGSERFDFIGGHDDALGYFESCALFSPMQGFDSQARAVETAQEVLSLTRPQSAVAPAVPTPPSEAVPSRRAFFTLGRGASAGAGP